MQLTFGNVTKASSLAFLNRNHKLAEEDKLIHNSYRSLHKEMESL